MPPMSERLCVLIEERVWPPRMTASTENPSLRTGVTGVSYRYSEKNDYWIMILRTE
jgi:hypothetical protein